MKCTCGEPMCTLKAISSRRLIGIVKYHEQHLGMELYLGGPALTDAGNITVWAVRDGRLQQVGWIDVAGEKLEIL